MSIMQLLQLKLLFALLIYHGAVFTIGKNEFGSHH